MAPTKKNLKETHLADQESTGIDVPAEVQGNIELAPAEVAKPKRGRPSTKAAKTDGNDEKKPKKIKKIPEQEAVATGEEKIITDNAPVEPATTEIKNTNETVNLSIALFEQCLPHCSASLFFILVQICSSKKIDIKNCSV